MSTTVTTQTATPVRRRRLGSTELVYLALLGVVIIGAVLVGIRGDNLLSTANTVDMLTRSSLLGFVALGQTFVILCRSLDLSVGYVMALSSLIGATTMAGDAARIPLGIAVVVLVAGAIGLANGLIITLLKVNPFITTLGMGLIIKGYLDTQYKGPAGEVPSVFQQFGYSRIGPVPLSAAVMLIAVVAGILYLRKTRTGYHMYAVGGSDDVARLSGIRTGRVMIISHVLCSIAAGVAGLLIAARFGTGSALVYDSGYELDSIAAVVLGGTFLMGGRGGVAGTLAGVLILAELDTIFNILQVDPFFKDVLRGVVIIAAVAIYARRYHDRQATRVRFRGNGGGGERRGRDPGAPPDSADDESVPAGHGGGR
ncbi:monosaccharide ABC transporter membrane protein (CUT2 family) [Haloactinopolyspora alba]|uniref:Monosaccharide ABC transporter membrane protein (CUT2 family) n=1 Tax=Haloactinopolyspora alba TaxID=648780 RepID=A0A2P8EBX4_9ACTN|nr:ABC transporter permease [Haloactinopolyspora alba]PSL06979.1 monosaccharide ABC transporter membrane protein (CUT2 family) [Haloactinopolyspora alba]